MDNNNEGANDSEVRIASFKNLDGGSSMEVTFRGQHLAYVDLLSDNTYKIETTDPYTTRYRRTTRKTLAAAQRVLNKHLQDMVQETVQIDFN